MAPPEMQEMHARAECLRRHLRRMERDGLANSLGHWRKATEDSDALLEMLAGGVPAAEPHLD